MEKQTSSITATLDFIVDYIIRILRQKSTIDRSEYERGYVEACEEIEEYINTVKTLLNKL